MMLGKRMKRTTSTSEFLDSYGKRESNPTATGLAVAIPTTSSPYKRPTAEDITKTSPFLRYCDFCHRRLLQGKDIYMYMGDTAFCSVECREKGMNEVEEKEKCLSAKKQLQEASSSSSGSKTSSNGRICFIVA